MPFGFRFVKLGNFFFQRTTGQRHAERAFLERGSAASASAFFQEALGAGILALLVAPDAIVGVIQRTGEIGSRVGQLETFAAAQAAHVKTKLGITLATVYRGWHQILRIELMRGLEQHTGRMLQFTRCRLRCPSGILQCGLQLDGMSSLIFLPPRHVLRERQLCQRRAHPAFKLRGQRRAVKRFSFRPFYLVHGLALHKQALHGIQRRQRVVLTGKRRQLTLDTEQLRDERIHMRRQCDQQLGFNFDCDARRVLARRQNTLLQIAIGSAHERKERRVQPDQRRCIIEIGEGQPEAKRQGFSDRSCINRCYQVSLNIDKKPWIIAEYAIRLKKLDV